MMFDVSKFMLDGSILVALFTAIVLYVGMRHPRWFLTKQDVPADILAAAPAQTEAEKRQAKWAALPLVLIFMGGTLYSTYTFAQQSGANFLTLFLYALGLVLFISLFDLIVIDWLVLNTLTPKWAVFPGTEGFAGYKNYGFHGRAHLRALPGQVLAAAAIAGMVWLLL